MGKARPAVLHKLIRPTIKAVDEDNFTVDAVVSTEAKDRDGDILKATGFRLENFLSHPVLLTSHDTRSLTSQIGEWTMRGRAAFSVGFIPDWEKAEVIDGGDPFFGPFIFDNMELLEVSQVTVPANQDALQRMKGLDLHPDIEAIVEELLTAGTQKTTDNPEVEAVIRQLAADITAPIEERFESLQEDFDGQIAEIRQAVLELTKPDVFINVAGDDPDCNPNNDDDPPAFDVAAILAQHINAEALAGVSQ